MNELYATLLSWAVVLTGYPTPAVPPIVSPKPHSFFVENACGGRECKVWGWYSGGEEIFIDERLDPANSLLASSIVVHEMVHYLQSTSRRASAAIAGVSVVQPDSCEDSKQWEYEAYGAQKEFIHRYGRYLPVGISMFTFNCSGDGPILSVS